MVTWNEQQVREYELRQAGAARLRASEPERDSGLPLVKVAPRKRTRLEIPESRYVITFTVFRVHPLDWDNHFCKPLQDVLVSSGFLPDDNWRVLEGRFQSRKCGSKSEQRTEITIERLT
jgi:hypothetical protein